MKNIIGKILTISGIAVIGAVALLAVVVTAAAILLNDDDGYDNYDPYDGCLSGYGDGGDAKGEDA